MHSNNRANLLTIIAELGDRYPHWRFGQLISNVSGWADINIWDVEDNQILDAAKAHLEALGD